MTDDVKGLDLPNADGYWTRSDGHNRSPASDWSAIIVRWVNGVLRYRGFVGSGEVSGPVENSQELLRGGWIKRQAVRCDDGRKALIALHRVRTLDRLPDPQHDKGAPYGGGPPTEPPKGPRPVGFA